MYTGNSQTATKAVELFQAQLKKVNINLELEPLDRAEVTKRKRARDFDTYWAGEAPRTDLDGSLNLAVHPTGAFNFNDIDDPKVTALLADQRSEADPVKRRELHREVLQYMNENAILNPTWRGTRFIFKQPYLKGWHHQQTTGKSAPSGTPGWTNRPPNCKPRYCKSEGRCVLSMLMPT